MKNLLLSLKKQNIQVISRIIFVLFILGFMSSPSQAQITGITSGSRCGAGTVTLYATAASGTITWYAVPFYGTPVGTGTSFTTPSLSVTTSYFVDALDGTGCSLNPNQARWTVVATISASAMQAVIFYSSSTFCTSLNTWQQVTQTGQAGGTYTVSPSGLDINASTGAILPSASATGTYTVTYTVTPQPGCTQNPATTIVTITAAPTQPVISYTGSPYCTSHDLVIATQTGETGGTYSASPSGLTINSVSGTITPSSSFSGTYTITYFVSGAGGCAPMTATTSVTILQLPTAAISYATPFCHSGGIQPVTLSGTGVYTGGVFSAPAALSINASTGTINPAASTPGTYTVTYTLAAVPPCTSVVAQTSVTINSLPTASLSGTAAICSGNSTNLTVAFTGTQPWSFTYTDGSVPVTITGLTSSPYIFSVNPSLTTTYSLTAVNDANCTGTTSGTAIVTVTALPIASFSYDGTPYCSNGTDPLPTLPQGSVAGTFSSASGLVFINASTGEIDLSASTPGTYTVTNTIAPAGGCSQVTATSGITITHLPVATFTYASNTYCTTGSNPTPTGAGVGNGTFTSVPGGVVFVSASTGQINLSSSTPGTYQIVNTIDAAGGCSVVTATFNNLTIGAPPSSPSIAYSGSPYCNSIVVSQPVELVGTTGGTFTVSPSGLTIDGSSGAITPSTSTPGSYTVTYTVGGGGGCSVLTATATVIIYQTPAVNNNASKTICSGTNTAITLTASMPSTFTWTLGNVSSIVTGASIGSGASISQTLHNISFALSGSVEYIVTPVSTANGCVGAPYTITVTVNPLPYLTITPPAPVCSPNTVDLTNSSITAGSTDGLTFTYWNDQDCTSSFTHPTTAGAGTYYIRGTVPATGCFSTRDVTVIVNPLPTPTISGNTPVCLNSTGNTYTTESGMTGYSWSVTGGTITSGSGTNTIAVTWTQAGTESVSVNYLDGNGCTAADPTIYNVTVHALPIPTISGNSPVCLNSTNTYTTETGKSGYSWSVTGGTITSGTGTNAIDVTWTTSGTESVSVNYTDGNGCTAASQTSYPVTVYSNLTAGISGGTSPVCSDFDPGTFTATGSGGTGSYTYLWYMNGNSTSVTTQTYDPGNLISTSTFYCAITSGSCGTVNTPTTTITVLSILTGNISGGSSPICYNTDPGVLTANCFGSTGPYNYLWYKGGVNTGIITSTYDPGALTSTTNILCRIESSFCPAYSVWIYKLITVDANLTASISGGTSPICSNTSPGTFTATGSGGTGSYTYQWYSTSGIISGETNSTYNPGTITTTTGYYCAVTSGSCGTVNTSTTTIIVNDLPVAGTITGGSAVCMGSTLQLTSNATGTATLTYTWASSNHSVATVNNSGVVTPVAPGTTDITYTVTDGSSTSCQATSPNYTVTVNALPVALVLTGSTICSTAGSNGSITSTTSETGVNYQLYSSIGGTIQNAQAGTGDVLVWSGLSGGSGYYVIGTTNTTTTCAGPQSNAVDISITPAPTASAGGSQTICSNGTATVSGASASNGSILWTIGSAWGSISNQTTLTPTYTASQFDAGTTVTLTMTVSGSGVCNGQSATASYLIHVYPIPTASTGSSPFIYMCSNSSATVSGATSSNGTILWTHDGHGTLTNATTLTPTYTASALDGTVVILTMTVSSDPVCSPPITAVAHEWIYVTQAPTLSGVSQVSIPCDGNSATIELSGVLPNSMQVISYSINGIPQPDYTIGTGTNDNTLNLSTSNLNYANPLSLEVTQITRIWVTPSCTQTFTQNNTTSLAVNKTTVPTVNSPICNGANSISGGSQEADNTAIWVYNGSSLSGITTVSGNVWTLSSSVSAGDLITAKAIPVDGCVSEASSGITVKSNTSAPIVTSTICAGATSVSGTSETGASIVVYSGSSQIGTATASGTSWTATVTPVTANSSISATAIVSGKCISAASSPVTVNPVPVANPIIGTPTPCLGSSGVPYSVTNNNSGTNTYTWSYSGTGANLSSTSGNAITIDFPSGATSGTLTVVEAVSSTGCSTTNTSALTVTPLPTSVISGSATTCTGSSTTISVALTGTAPWNLTWYDGSTSTPVTGILSSPYTFSVSPTTTTTYTVTAVSDALCTGTSFTGSALVTVNPLPDSPVPGTNVPSQTQIVWNWNAVTGATGYKWNTSNTYSGATDLGNVLTKTETLLTCNTGYTRYIWAYNASGCVSAVTPLTQTTSDCGQYIYLLPYLHGLVLPPSAKKQ